jgi:hypothetical protein
MSRGGLMLRCAADRQELSYLPVAGAIVNGKRPPKLAPRRYATAVRAYLPKVAPKARSHTGASPQELIVAKAALKARVSLAPEEHRERARRKRS